ncbi:vanadium-dependent haloperoxidase [Streptomyces laculatispora]|uniref:Vanadium-dependent haloperoxidase n=1 Tax=Streptomyces laculatispora TaxID=887464 RepID=A0ABY9HZW4_9ACTN|nr:vanadium-dependent haloperoxidase [Streptomyces laculatispora]MBO0913732.1 vanadium-dependent haloperoxidase [Streptomyces laculatispora]WLQ40105.1 vanadium-dependent haloperoxidase [Streptomyces laculatispora]
MRMPRTLTSRARAGTSAAVVTMLLGTAIGTSGGTATAAEATKGKDNVVLQWNQTTYDALVKKAAEVNGLQRPPLGSRSLAIVHTCMYDAWSAYDARAVGTQLGDDLRQPYHKRTLANRKTAINYAAYDALNYLYPEFKSDFDAKMMALGMDPANTSRDTRTSAGVAHTACDAVIADRRTDGSNQENAFADTTGYTAFNPPQDLAALDKSTVLDPVRWTPLSTNGVVPPFVTPQWGGMKPFAIKDPAAFQPPPPPAYGSAKLKADIKTMMDYNANLTDRRKVVSEYWLENRETPAGHQNKWAQYISRRDHNTLDEDVKMFFTLNLAMADAGIVAWKSKVRYDYARPITVIRYSRSGHQVSGYAGRGKGTQTIAGETWLPYVTTPPFASYVSGHAMWGGTAAESLKLWTGSDKFGASFTAKAGSSVYEPGLTPASDVTLKWDTLSQAATEDGMSRVYGGGHWTFDVVEGQKLGRTVAKTAFGAAMKYINGTA